MTEGGPSDENNKDNGHHETNEHENGDKHCSVAGDDNDNGDDDKQYLFIIRHGDRWDYANPEVCKAKRKAFPLIVFPLLLRLKLHCIHLMSSPFFYYKNCKCGKK